MVVLKADRTVTSCSCPLPLVGRVSEGLPARSLRKGLSSTRPTSALPRPPRPSAKGGERRSPLPSPLPLAGEVGRGFTRSARGHSNSDIQDYGPSRPLSNSPPLCGREGPARRLLHGGMTPGRSSRRLKLRLACRHKGERAARPSLTTLLVPGMTPFFIFTLLPEVLLPSPLPLAGEVGRGFTRSAIGHSNSDIPDHGPSRPLSNSPPLCGREGRPRAALP
ncbi:hypothetical protein QO014_000967 [Kaistia dalseonensis]|uniref:Uncharacterized protein n=1 Tax=Kaistia dalseonensis TaxID=410840 RepID=A0ABU0H2R0_9HYPH|nr:hypothetical protein [Kaistia dalseonensis]